MNVTYTYSHSTDTKINLGLAAVPMLNQFITQSCSMIPIFWGGILTSEADPDSHIKQSALREEANKMGFGVCSLRPGGLSILCPLKEICH